ncbi:hypothetical protein [Rhizobium sp. BK176]|uniref:hypothetical protein n=1 Tax=Rhizobium sp. BK176 TaxID=2587071 RepID=UPI002168D4AD|nr:hypothetical protein [Rhizobium sp. BK176]MCS4088869.1 hypothetical protein [Rhizobium sp. BK176]
MSPVKMPFLHRFVGRTPRSSEIRHLAAWDIAEVEIPKRDVSEFEIGSRLAADEVLTYTTGADHWAYADGHVMPVSGKGSSDAKVEDTNRGDLVILMNKIGGAKFFNEGAFLLKDPEILSKTPSPQYVEVSQRQAIVERIAEYAGENFAEVDGHLLTRVHEPSLCLKVWRRPNVEGKCYLQMLQPLLVPWQGTTHNTGLHFGLNDIREIEELCRSLIGPELICDELIHMFDRDRYADMACHVDQIEDMRTRSLLGVAAGIAGKRVLKTSTYTETFRMISDLSLKAASELTEAEGGAVLDALNAGPQWCHLTSAERLMVRLAEEQWDARPVNTASLLMSPGLHRTP